MSSSSSFPPVVSPHCLSVPVLYKLLRGEEEPCRVWLRDELNQIADPVIDSLFVSLIMSSSSVVAQSRSTLSELCELLEGKKVEMSRVLREAMDRLVSTLFEGLINKLRMTNEDLDRSEDVDDRAQAGNQLDQETLHVRMHRAILEYEASNQLQNEDNQDENEESGSVEKAQIDTTHQANHTIEPDIKEEIDDDQTTYDELITIRQTHNPLDQENTLHFSLHRANLEYETSNQLRNEQVIADNEAYLDEDIESGSVENAQIGTTHQVNHNIEWDMAGLDESRTVENAQIEPTPSHSNEQTLGIAKQSTRHLKRKLTDEKQPNEVDNQLDSQEDEDEADEAQEVSSRSVKQTTLSSTKQFHIITHTLQCPVSGCNAMIEKDKYKKHIEEEHSMGQYWCLVRNCDRTFTSKVILGQHLTLSHPSTRQWYCHKCNKHFASYKQLSIHNYQLHQLGHFQCSFSACTFTGEYRMKVFNHHSQHRQTLKCAQSGCTYETPCTRNLKIHQRAHLGIKPYKCNWSGCDYAATIRSNTIGHIRRMHFNGNPSLSVRLGDYIDHVNEILLDNPDGRDDDDDANVNSTSTKQNTQFITPYPRLPNLNFHPHQLNQTPNPNLYFTKSNAQSNHNLTNCANVEYQMNTLSNHQQQANSFGHVESSSITQFHQPLSSFTSYYNSNYYKPSTFNPHCRQPSYFNAHQPSTSFTSFLNPHFHQQHSITYEMALQNTMDINTSRSNPQFRQQVEDDEFDEYEEEEGGGVDMSYQVGNIAHRVQFGVRKNEDMQREDDDIEEVTTFRPVKRPRSRSKQNTQIITHTLQCPQCGQLFAKDEFNFHMKVKHSIGQFRCLVKDCAQSFHSTYFLNQHLAQSHQSTTELYCDKCDKHFTAYHLLSVHNTQYHQFGHFQCSFPLCTFTGEYKQKVYDHYKVQHKQK